MMRTGKNLLSSLRTWRCWTHYYFSSDEELNAHEIIPLLVKKEGSQGKSKLTREVMIECIFIHHVKVFVQFYDVLFYFRLNFSNPFKHSSLFFFPFCGHFLTFELYLHINSSILKKNLTEIVHLEFHHLSSLFFDIYIAIFAPK